MNNNTQVLDDYIKRISLLENGIPYSGSEQETKIESEINNSIFDYDSSTIYPLIVNQMLTINKENLEYYSLFFEELSENDFIILYKDGRNVRVENIVEQLRNNLKTNVTNVVVGEDKKPIIYTEILNCDIDIDTSAGQGRGDSNRELFRSFLFTWYDEFSQITHKESKFGDYKVNTRRFDMSWEDNFDQIKVEESGEFIDYDEEEARCFYFWWGDYRPQTDPRQLNFNDGSVTIEEFCELCEIEDRTFSFSWTDNLPQTIEEGTPVGLAGPNDRMFSFSWSDDFENMEPEDETGTTSIGYNDGERFFDIHLINVSPEIEFSSDPNVRGPRLSDRIFNISLRNVSPSAISGSNSGSSINPSIPPLSTRVFSLHLYHSKITPNYGSGTSCSQCSTSSAGGSGRSSGWNKPSWSTSTTSAGGSSTGTTSSPRGSSPGSGGGSGGGGGGGGPVEPLKTKPDITISLSCGMTANTMFLNDGGNSVSVEVPTITKMCDTGLYSTSITDDGYLVINFYACDNTPFVAGKVRGNDGIDGKSIVYFDIVDSILKSVVTTVHGKYTPDVAYEKTIGKLEVPYIEDGFINPDGYLTFKDNNGLYLVTSADIIKNIKNGKSGDIPKITSFVDSSGELYLMVESNNNIVIDKVIREKSKLEARLGKNNEIIISGNGKFLKLDKYSGNIINITDLAVKDNRLIIEKNNTDVEFLDKSLYDAIESIEVTHDKIKVSSSNHSWELDHDIVGGTDGINIDSVNDTFEETVIAMDDKTTYNIPKRNILRGMDIVDEGDGLALNFNVTKGE